MKTAMIGAVLVAVLALSNGCCTRAFVQKHDAAVLQIRASQDGKAVYAGLNVLDLTGWWAACKADPVGAVVNTGADALIATATVIGVNEIGKKANWWGGEDDSGTTAGGTSSTSTKDSHATDSHATTINVTTGDGSPVVINNGGDGGQGNSTP